MWAAGLKQRAEGREYERKHNKRGRNAGNCFIKGKKMRAAGRKLRAEGRVHTKRVPQAENGVPKAAYTQKTRAAGQKQRAEGRTSFYSRKKRAAG